MGRLFHHPGTVNENVLESDFEPLCDGTTRRRSLVVQPRNDKGLDKKLCSVLCQKGPDFSDVV